jgi:Asp-tRNA(Asn)/Glu-tRNA(Gln) amidotransferase A subunit family amidase
VHGGQVSKEHSIGLSARRLQEPSRFLQLGTILIRAHNRTNYFVDNGVQLGATYEHLKHFEDRLNKYLKTGNLRIHVVCIPMPRDLMLTALKEGRIDLDPNVWFGNVERIVSARIGRETVDYVSNIFKYYIAYRLVIQEEQREEQRKEALRAGVASGNSNSPHRCDPDAACTAAITRTSHYPCAGYHSGGMNTRRQFLITAPLGALAASLACRTEPKGATSTPPPTTPGAPPTFGTGPVTGPPLSASTFADAEKLAQVTMSPAEREMAAASWPRSMAPLVERRVGPRKVALDSALAPATQWNPLPIGGSAAPTRDRFVRSASESVPLPSNDADIAFAPVSRLSRWIEQKALSSERLTNTYLRRIEQFDPKLRCVITLTKDVALAQARQADAEIAAGKYRGPLHGIPYGVKDLLDTAGVATTYGAEPFRNRVPTEDAAVVKRLKDAGAVLIAKLSLGALALNDIWFGGQTMNPWLLEEGASGSSAGPGAATAAALVAFSIGSETGGSIVAPAMRCGVTGLRPTFGRVARTGAMTLCWSLDKLGPMTRSVEDAMLVLHAIDGPDAGDVSSLQSHLDFDAAADATGIRVGYFPAWMKESPATDVDRAALETVRKLGMVPTEVSLPDWPYGSLMPILFSEAAAAFEEITLNGDLRTLKVQVPDAWPNLFREARFLSAVDFVQADRFRRRVAVEVARVFSQVDVLLVPSLRDEMLTVSNFTGHPSLTLRAGFVNVLEARSDWAPDPNNPLPKFSPPRRVPHGVTLIGRLFDEGTVARAGIALERAFGVSSERPPGF